MRSFVMVVAMVVSGLTGSAYAAEADDVDDGGMSLMNDGDWVYHECRDACTGDWALSRDLCQVFPGDAAFECMADVAKQVGKCNLNCRRMFPPGGDNLPVIAEPTDDLFPQMGILCYKACWNHSLSCFSGCIGEDTEAECDDICNDEHLECRAGCDVIFSNGNI